MAGKQAVTIGTMHVCPMVSVLIPHVGGPIIGPGCVGVRINGTPVSIQGDVCVCAAGGPDAIIEGCPGVQINGTPLTVQNSMTAHGGMVPIGESGVLISSNTSSVFSMAKDREPVIYNVQWRQGEEKYITRGSKSLKVVTVTADTRNIDDGEKAIITIYRNIDGQEEEVIQLEGFVNNNSVEVEWEVEEIKEEKEDDSLNGNEDEESIA